ncbi:DDE-type integrase/transposase/recombinase, partial [Micromonospora sp. NPDC049891]|uniref:DDE-type integrase/transposase/recombinase n=1 Tax=Micromonospora sp. NPDC049891 TaxID=3155655 RepID=UPI00340AB3FB
MDAAAVDIRWCGDITYINTWEGWLYLATVIDLASHRVVGWAVADHLKTDLVDAALSDALRRRRPADGLVFHSDRGCQGGFNRSSQHLDHGGVHGQEHEAGAGAGKGAEA